MASSSSPSSSIIALFYRLFEFDRDLSSQDHSPDQISALWFSLVMDRRPSPIWHRLPQISLTSYSRWQLVLIPRYHIQPSNSRAEPFLVFRPTCLNSRRLFFASLCRRHLINMFAQQRWPGASPALAIALAFCSTFGLTTALDDSDIRPQYHYGAKIPVTCLDRSMYASL